MRTLAVLAVLVGALAGFPPAAAADEASDAKQLFEEARALLEQQRYPEACEKFARSFELDRKPGTQLNLGECAEREGRIRRAWLLFDDAARTYDKIRLGAEARLARDPSSAEAKRDSAVAVAGARLARDRADALVPKLATVIVRIAEPRVTGLAIRIGDHAAPPAAEIVEHLDAGTLTITAAAPGRAPFSTTGIAAAGGQVVIEIPRMHVLDDGATPPPGGVPAVGAGRRDRARVRIAYGVAAGGAVVLGISSVLGLQARAKYHDAEARCVRVGGELQCPAGPAADIASAGTTADRATILAIGGGALAAGAIILYLTAPREHLTISPTASPGGAGVTISGRF